MFDPYEMCRVCGGKGYYMKKENVGSHTFETPKHCEYCGGKGKILKSKLRIKPLYDKFGRPIDQFGRVVKTPKQEPWYRRKRREKFQR